MAIALYEGAPCTACGKPHDLYDAGPQPHTSSLAAYTYTCPETGTVVRVRLTVAPRIVPAPPAAAVVLERASGYGPTSDAP